MARRQALAPPGYFTIADVSDLAHVERNRVRFWCSRWGAGLLAPAVNPEVRGRTRLFSERDLIRIALIPTLLEAALDHEQVRHLFTKAKPAWWDLSRAHDENRNFLDWIVLVWGRQVSPRWYLVASAYEGGPAGRINSAPMDALMQFINDAIWKIGPIRGYQVIELSNVKRELLERIGKMQAHGHD
jgi:DNA-binding transcriptional MerR regulator